MVGVLLELDDDVVVFLWLRFFWSLHVLEWGICLSDMSGDLSKYPKRF